MARGIPNNRPTSTDDLAMRDYQVLDLTSPMLPPAGGENIVSVESHALPPTHADRLAFNEEPIEIRLEPRAERNPRRVARVSVNGEIRWIPIGVPVRVQRKFVEVLARAQPFGVTTDVGNAMEANPHNRVIRTPFREYPFTVLKDPSPRGNAWLNKISYEG